MGVVAIHVETGASGREHHRVPTLGKLGGELDRVVHGRGHLDRYDRLEDGPDLGRGLADENRGAPVLLHDLGQRRVRAALVLATRDEHDLARESVERRHHGAHVGALGIVVELDIVEVAHQLHAMGQRTERNQRVAGLGWQGSDQARGHQRGEGVLLIVPAHQARQLRGIVFDGAAGKTDAQGIALEPTADAKRPVGRDEHAPALDVAGRGLDVGVVDVDHGKVRRGLGGEDALFGGDVAREIGVAVEVVGRDIEQHRHLGAECTHGFELEAGHLNHAVPAWTPRVRADGFGQRRAQVAAHEGGPAIGPQHGATQGRGGRFAVGARDGDHGRFHVPRRQLEFARDEHALGPCGVDLGHGRDARGQHDQVLSDEDLGGMSPQFLAHGRRQKGQVRTQLGGVLGVVHGHARSTHGAQPRRRDPGAAKADHQDAFAGQIALGRLHQRTFNVSSKPTMAQKKETIQKRTTMRDSGQPFFSKW